MLSFSWLGTSRARVITVSAGARSNPPDPPGLFVLIEDDGVGIADGNEHSGYGLNNMTERARMLDGHLRVEGNGSGTRVELWFPALPGVTPPSG